METWTGELSVSPTSEVEVSDERDVASAYWAAPVSTSLVPDFVGSEFLTLGQGV